MSRKVEDIRNIAICGHGSSGKTTLVDRILVKTGMINANPSVDDGTSICDFDEEEKNHKYSIEASITHFDYAGKRFNMIDTPGYPDLIGQTIGALRAVEMALIAIDAHAGIKVNTRRVWEEAEKAGIGRMIVITKLNMDNIDFPALVDSIREVFGNQCTLLNVPLGQGHDFRGVASTLKVPADTAGALIDPNELHEPLIESIIEVDDAVMEQYFEGVMPSDQDLSRLMVDAIAAGTLVPIVCVSGKHDIGVDAFLDVLNVAAPPPTAIQRKAMQNGDEITLQSDPSAPLVAQVFKTRIDPFVQRLSYIRVFSGTLKKDMVVPSPGSRKGIKIGPLLEVQANETKSIETAIPGDLVAIAKSEELHTGTTLGEAELPPIKFPTPMVGLAVRPKSRGDETKLSSSLQKIVEEDSTIQLELDQETKEMVLTGMSELHLMLIQERLKRRDKVEVETHEPKIPYRETIQANAEGSYRHKKQSGGAGQFAEVHIRMYPLPEGTDVETYAVKDRFPQLKNVHYHEDSNFLWLDSVVGGSIPGNFMPAIEKGFLERIHQGVIAGCRVQNICVEVFYGKDHPVDSNETAFRTAANRAFSEVFRKARPVLLEPMVRMHITVPADNVGDVSSDMSGRRGQMVGMESAGGGMTTVETRVPLAEVSTYARTLLSMTGGQGSYSMDFAGYEFVPPNIQQEIIAKAKMKKDED
ncbi:MAG: elongation factor G [Pirellulales bacterium]|nr:elongation factor G [Pirellulales bacterium]